MQYIMAANIYDFIALSATLLHSTYLLFLPSALSSCFCLAIARSISNLEFFFFSFFSSSLGGTSAWARLVRSVGVRLPGIRQKRSWWIVMLYYWYRFIIIFCLQTAILSFTILHLIIVSNNLAKPFVNFCMVKQNLMSNLCFKSVYLS